MRFLIVAVGRWREGPARALFDEFAKRLSPAPELIEVEEKRKVGTPERVRREGDLLLARVPDDSFVIALDGRGKALSSEELAGQFEALQAHGTAATFVIGGADGLAPTVLARADLTLSLGPMTWPHMLVRVMLAEQIYRAEAIRAGHPYHRSGPPPI